MNSYTSLACHMVRKSMQWTGEHAKTAAGATNPVNALHTMMNALHVVSGATGKVLREKQAAEAAALRARSKKQVSPTSAQTGETTGLQRPTQTARRAPHQCHRQHRG